MRMECSSTGAEQVRQEACSASGFVELRTSLRQASQCVMTVVHTPSQPTRYAAGLRM